MPVGVSKQVRMKRGCGGEQAGVMMERARKPGRPNPRNGGMFADSFGPTSRLFNIECRLCNADVLDRIERGGGCPGEIMIKRSKNSSHLNSC